MNGAVFGSYSLTEFMDLYHLNVRDNHHYCFFIEVNADGIVGIEQGSYLNIKKMDCSNYLIGILTEEIDNVKIEKYTLEYLESKHISNDVNYLIDTKKEFFYFAYNNSRAVFASYKTVTFHTSENRSFSTVSPNGYTAVTRNLVYTMPIFKEGSFDCDENDIA